VQLRLLQFHAEEALRHGAHVVAYDQGSAISNHGTTAGCPGGRNDVGGAFKLIDLIGKRWPAQDELVVSIQADTGTA
jgi:hypothetical protein